MRRRLTLTPHGASIKLRRGTGRLACVSDFLPSHQPVQKCLECIIQFTRYCVSKLVETEQGETGCSGCRSTQ